ncbi:hypothetical protein EC991_002069 [Linnemannia zychae]|nr:hypothetical protein EC991_002069 [Linnemannia zychae]
MKVLDLCDITKRGSLDKDEFTLGLELIRRKISNPDMLIPEALPLSMIPPSLRHHVHLKPAHSGSDNYAPVGKEEKLEQKSKIDSEALASIARIKQFLKPDTSEFGDMWKLPPPISPPQTKKEPTDTQVSIGLNGDLRTKSAIPKQDPLNSLKSQLQREGKAVEDLKMERLHLESETSHAQETRAMMEQRLSNLKDQQKRESKAAQDLKTTLATMESELSTLRSAIAVSKRELEIAQADKTAFLNALKNGQEESLELKATLQRSQDEVFKLRTHLEARIRILGLDPLDYPGTGTGEIVRAASVVGGGVGTRSSENQNRKGPSKDLKIMEYRKMKC